MTRLLVLILFLSLPALARPAPWYRWESRLDGARICAQVAPGEGWTQVGGPYRDAQCSIRAPG